MYFLIDMDQLAVTHKHADREVLNGLAWIECKCAAKIFPLGDPRMLEQRLTSSEMMSIYKAATGQFPTAYANQLATLLHDLVKRMPDTEAVREEVEAQVKHVLPASPANYRYVLGAKVPEELPGLFNAKPIAVAHSEAEQAAIAKTTAAYAAQAARNAPPAGPPPLPATPVPPAPPRAPREPGAAPSTPRAGGVRDIVFSVADREWEAANKPTDLSVVLKLRKHIMDVLERDHNLKRTTASTTLGDWQKQRLT